MTRGGIALALTLIAVVAFVGWAGAESGNFEDATDDTESLLNIAEVTHDDDQDTITYTLELHQEEGADPWDPADNENFAISWELSLTGDAAPEICVDVTHDDEPSTPDGLVYAVTDCDSEVFDEGDATLASNTLTVVWDRAALGEAGFGEATGYDYAVFTTEDTTAEPPVIADSAPDEGAEELIRHDLTAQQETTTTTASEATTTTTTVATSPVTIAPASPATPVSANPTFTG